MGKPPPESNSTPDSIKLVYDRACPVCRFYAERTAIDRGRLELVNAREAGELRDELTARGVDIDAGMAIKIGAALYTGSEAMHELALRSADNGVANRLARWLFRSPRRARIFYPPLVGARKLLLKLLGRPPIDNLGKQSR